MKKTKGIPKKSVIWLVFDISNGDCEGDHGYVWWFSTVIKACSFIVQHDKGKHATTLSQPIRYTLSI